MNAAVVWPPPRVESLAETRAPSSRRRVLQEPDRAVVSSRIAVYRGRPCHLPLVTLRQPFRQEQCGDSTPRLVHLFGLRLDKLDIASTGVQSDTQSLTTSSIDSCSALCPA